MGNRAKKSRTHVPDTGMRVELWNAYLTPARNAAGFVWESEHGVTRTYVGAATHPASSRSAIDSRVIACAARYFSAVTTRTMIVVVPSFIFPTVTVVLVFPRSQRNSMV